jgi:hypothetical protein
MMGVGPHDEQGEAADPGGQRRRDPRLGVGVDVKVILA